MQSMRILAVVLIVVGLLALAYEGINYTQREKVLEVGPITATKETTKTIPLPPILGGAALVCRRGLADRQGAALGALA